MTNHTYQIKTHLSKADPFMKKVVDTIPFPKIEVSGSLFHDLMGCIIEQQIHYRSTKKTYEKLLTEAGITLLTPDNFSQLETLSLAKRQLSMQKIETIAAVLKKFNEQHYDWENLSDNDIHTILGSIKGIGKKTINLLLMYTLERPSVFIEDDYHVLPLMVEHYALEKSKNRRLELQNIIANYAPFQSYAFKYLVHYKQALKRGLI